MKTKNISARYVERAQQMVQNEESAKCRLQVHRKGALCVCVAVCSFCLCLCLNIRRPACISVAMSVSTNKHDLYFRPRWSSRRGRRCWRRGRRASSTARCSSSPRWRRTRGRRRTSRERRMLMVWIVNGEGDIQMTIACVVDRRPFSTLEELGIDCLDHQRKIHTV